MAAISPSERYVCIHGHFYQPPRENPWLEAVETQDTAAPYHDWNDRITAECYAPNGAARIVDGNNRIVRIVNNYAWMSFNFGPTLLSWLEENAPLTYSMIRDADRLSQRRFSGHGSALAQVYNHIIMPLASQRDRETQILWGIADFEHRFGRKPEGMWLAETAVDTETLDLLAKHGIRFTLLAPHQCARVRLQRAAGRTAAAEEAEPALELAPEHAFWTETPDASVDTTHPYLVPLREGRSIAVFFYNGPLSRAIAFEGLLNSGDTFARRLSEGFHARGARDGSSGPQLVHVATDGESYGHHHRHGEMALSYALSSIEEKGIAQLTNYGEFLAKFPPSWEAEINDDSSWSCSHGVERWRANCGCNGGAADWNQEWRAPLRAALDWLRDGVAPLVEAAGRELLTDATAARNDYIHVILDRISADHPAIDRRRLGPRLTPEEAEADGQEVHGVPMRRSIDRFFAKHTTCTLTRNQRTRALKLMELERHALLMYTSCGWFFDEISGIETVQIIAYAARALQLATEIFPLDKATLEAEFITRLSTAKSNVPEWEDGGSIYRQLIQPMEVGLEQVVAHYAISSVFADVDRMPANDRLFCYTLAKESEVAIPYGAGQFLLGRVRVCSTLTEECETVAFAVLHFGDQNLTAAVKRFTPADQEPLARLEARASKAIAEANLPEVVRLIDAYFGASRYSLTSLFTDEQRRILDRILSPTLEEVETSLTSIYSAHTSLLNFLSHTGLPKPASLTVAAQFAINAQLRRAMEAEHIDAPRILALLARARTDMVVVDTQTLSFIADERMKSAMLELEKAPRGPLAVEHALALAKALEALPFALDLWQAQNIWYGLSKAMARGGEEHDTALLAWRKNFNELGRHLRINVKELQEERERTTA